MLKYFEFIELNKTYYWGYCHLTFPCLMWLFYIIKA